MGGVRGEGYGGWGDGDGVLREALVCTGIWRLWGSVTFGWI